MSSSRLQGSFLVLGLVCSTGCGLCKNDIVSDVHSPDEKLRAVVFTRDCGATTDFTVHVSILGATEALPEGEGNVFRAENDDKVPPADVKVVWKDARGLLVRFSDRARIYRQSVILGPIMIRYEKLVP